jgi:phosphoglucosamine mutase
MKRLFGTDGIRAVAGTYPLDPPSIYALGSALVDLLRDEGLAPKILIGRDTRESGGWMERILICGIRDGGGRAVSAGVIPTSSISYLTRKHLFSAGIVISASHNPFHDNGIKIFSSAGFKISDDWEKRLEKAIPRLGRAVPEKMARVRADGRYLDDYKRFLKGRLAQAGRPKKLKVVLDCANGASSAVAPEVMNELGFRVVAIHHAPDGKNINAGCGSLHPQSLARTVVEVKADIGIAYDGDADRALWVDEKGRVLNGDHTLFVIARYMKEKRRLKSDSVVATTMSNMGLELALQKMGLTLVRTKVGDKYVLDKMIEIRSNLGGERSGHTIFLDECPTGDGILTSLKMLEVLAAKDSALSRLTRGLVEFPQILLNIPVREKVDFQEIPEIAAAIAKVGKLLKDRGRLDVRYSGTEPLARIMVEGKDLNLIQRYGQGIAAAIAKNLGA